MNTASARISRPMLHLSQSLGFLLAAAPLFAADRCSYAPIATGERRLGNWLLANALWLNFATAVGAPVSTTHFIVGTILGAGIAAGGLGAANWGTLGGIVAAGFLFWIKRAITYQPDMVAAARRTVPIR